MHRRISHRSSYAAVERIPGTSLATGQAMLQWKEYQARHWPQVKLCCSGKNTRHVIGHRSSYASGMNTRHVIGHRSSYAVERIPGTSLATGQAMLQWKEYQARHWPQVTVLQWKEYQAHWAAAVERIPARAPQKRRTGLTKLPKTCKMGHKVQPQQNVSHEGMVKMRIARVNMAS